jgi:hypothetical protein
MVLIWVRDIFIVKHSEVLKTLTKIYNQSKINAIRSDNGSEFIMKML